MLVLTGKGRRTLEAGGLPEGTRIYEDLAEAARAIIQ
jgi:D-glycero-D-manno-heptose 1,7-bisphosphate phosphatase